MSTEEEKTIFWFLKKQENEIEYHLLDFCNLCMHSLIEIIMLFEPDKIDKKILNEE